MQNYFYLFFLCFSIEEKHNNLFHLPIISVFVFHIQPKLLNGPKWSTVMCVQFRADRADLALKSARDFVFLHVFSAKTARNALFFKTARVRADFSA